MQKPNFWDNNESLIAKILLPIGFFYGVISSAKFGSKKPLKSKIPVLCIGNVSLGGSGKTPVAIAIAKKLIHINKNPYFLTRGYGGKLKNVLVDTDKMSPDEIGDEPALLSETAPTLIYPDRIKGAQQAYEKNAEVIIMDDGFQNPSLVKDVSFLVIDGEYGLGNGRIFPAGPLREYFERGAERANAIVIIGEDKHNIANTAPVSLPVIKADIIPDENDVRKIQGRDVVAFAGIGRPKKFFNTLQKIGCRVISKYEFKDHYPYEVKDIQPILDEAFRFGAVPVTTAKDYIKLTPDQQQQINSLNIDIKWQNEEVLDNILKSLFKTKHEKLLNE